MWPPPGWTPRVTLQVTLQLTCLRAQLEFPAKIFEEGEESCPVSPDQPGSHPAANTLMSLSQGPLVLESRFSPLPQGNNALVLSTTQTLGCGYNSILDAEEFCTLGEASCEHEWGGVLGNLAAGW